MEAGNIDGQFSENGFHLLNGQKNITFYTSQVVSAKDITQNLVVTSLSRIYNSELRESDAQIVLNQFPKFNKL